MFSTTTFNRSVLDSKNVLKFRHDFTGNLIMTPDNVFPNPIYWNESFIVEVNTPEDFGIKGNVVVPNTYTNIINPEGGYGVTIRSGESIRFIGTLIGGSKVWLVERISKQASLNVRGLLNQAGVVTDSAIVPGATYTQAEVQAILTKLRDLKSKLRNAGILAT